MEPPSFELDISIACDEGIRNFVKTTQSPENREEIESNITGMSISGKKDVASRLLQLLDINPERTNISLIISILDEEVLKEIENVFKGRWRVKEVRLEELVEKIKGRRFRYDELKRLIMDWIGEDTESVIHVIGTNRGKFIGEALAIYGIEGKKAELELINAGTDTEDLRRVFDSINLKNFETSAILDLIQKENNDYMNKKLKDEVFERLWNTGIGNRDLNTIDDLPLRKALKAIYLIKGLEKHRGIKVFTDVLAPLSILIEGLLYENINNKFLEDELLQRLYTAYESILKRYEKGPDKYEGTKDINYVKERLSGNVIVMDGLRYDLWLILKEIMINEGWKIRDEVFKVDSPSTTSNFREIIGITEDVGMINEKSYSLIKVAEKEIGKKNLKKFLKEGYDIKILHFNFIDTKVHNSSIDLYPLYEIIKKEFISGTIPVLKEVGSFYLISDHGFTDTKELKERYRHGGKSLWETLIPFAEIRL